MRIMISKAGEAHRVIFDQVSKAVRYYSGIALLRSVIGPENFQYLVLA